MKNKILVSVMSVVLGVSVFVTNMKICYAEGPNDSVVNEQLTKEQAIEDINFVLNVIKQNHVSAIEKIPDEVLEQKEIEINNLPEKLSVAEEWMHISSIVGKLHDAHTCVSIPPFLVNRLPFDIETVNNKFFCTSGDFKDHEIIAINGIEIDDLYKVFKGHFSYEIEEWTQYNFFEGNLNFIPEWKLLLSGINISDPIEVTFKLDDRELKQNFNLVPIEHLSVPEEPCVSYKIDVEKDIGIFKLNKGNYNKEFNNAVYEFFFEVKENKIKNIVVDLRNNSGGNPQCDNLFSIYLKDMSRLFYWRTETRKGNMLIKGCEPEIKQYVIGLREILPLFDGNIFILTSHGTFSAGMAFATTLSDNNWGKVVGEVPGNSPTFFAGFTETHNLPHSKLKFYTTFRRVYRPDHSKDPDRLVPDIPVPAKDALDKVYEIVDEQINYQIIETEHFKIIYPKSEIPKTEEVTRPLENNYERVTRDLGVTLDKKITVKLFKEKISLHKSIGCYGKNNLEWITGAVNNGIIKSTLELDTNHLKQVLVHEFTHIVTEKLNPDYIPFVLKEGIATYEAGQKNLKDKLIFIKSLPDDCGWIFKGQFSQDLSYSFAYSFTEFIIENFGYEKIIELLKVDYKHNKFDLSSVESIYKRWANNLLSICQEQG